MVMAESTILEDIHTGKVERLCRYFKAKVLSDHKSEGTNNTLKNAIDGERTIVYTDWSTSYVDIADYVELHITKNRMNRPPRKP